MPEPDCPASPIDDTIAHCVRSSEVQPRLPARAPAASAMSRARIPTLTIAPRPPNPSFPWAGMKLMRGDAGMGSPCPKWDGDYIDAALPQASTHLGTDELDAVRQALANMDAGLTVLDAAGRLLYANAAAARLVGYDSPSDLIAATAAGAMARFNLFGVDGQPFPPEQLPSRIALSGRSAQAVIRFRPREAGPDRWSSVRGVPVLDASGKPVRVVTFFSDVTGQQQEEVQRHFLLRATDELNASFDYEKTLATVAHLAVPALADWCAVDLLDGDRIKRVATAHVDPAKLALVAEIHEGLAGESLLDRRGPGAHPTGKKPQLVEKISHDMLAAAASRRGPAADHRAAGSCVPTSGCR